MKGIRFNPRVWATLLFVVGWVAAGSASAHQPKPPEGSSVSLSQAYKREFAFLQSEKASLKQRLDAKKERSKKKAAAAEAELAALQAQVLAATIEADRLAGLLEDAASSADAAAEGSEVIHTLLTRATATLEKGRIQLPEGDTPEARVLQLRTAFDKSIVLLGEYASIRTRRGVFFSADGKQVKGQLLSVGGVASFGVSDSTAGALAPAGHGRLKVWTEAPSARFARALAMGDRPPTLGVFLYESLDKGIEAKQKQSTLEHVASGGIIAWVIVGLGAGGLLMVLVRALILGWSGSRIDRSVAQLAPLVTRKRLAEAKKRCGALRGSTARVLRTTIDNLDGPRERLEDAVSEAILHEHAKLDRFGALILVVAAVAPLLGLLGTVTGMISTFDVITEFGTGDPKMLSGGISEALVTTELGLVVAIPTLLAGNILGSWSSGIKDALERAALRIGNLGAGIDVEAAAKKHAESAKELATETS